MRAAADAIRHRGPDHGVVAQWGRCTLGNRRLRVIDLATGDQPVANEDGSVVAVFNGEIYNFRSAARRARRAGPPADGTGDTPAIPHLYEQHGERFVERLDGMFALALWDAGRERLLLARDRFGKKPLLWTLLPDGSLAFASELKALLAFPGVRRAVEPGAARRVPRARLRARPARRRSRGSTASGPAASSSPRAGRCGWSATGSSRPAPRSPGARQSGSRRSATGCARLCASASSRTSRSERSSPAGSTRASSSRRWPRRAVTPCGRSRSDSRTAGTTSGATRGWSPSATARSTRSSSSSPTPRRSFPGSWRRTTSRSVTRPRFRPSSSASTPAASSPSRSRGTAATRSSAATSATARTRWPSASTASRGPPRPRRRARCG